MAEIRGEAKTIRELLSGTRYFIDYYQREYKVVDELLDYLRTRKDQELILDLNFK